MNRHVMSITYLPKIQAVLSGECTQTIRKLRKKPICKNDIITFHGWAGRPYRSKWDWRKRVIVTHAIKIKISEGGIDSRGSITGLPYYHEWKCPELDELAQLDFIDPPTGEALRDVLFGLNGAPAELEEYQIIRWNNVEL